MKKFFSALVLGVASVAQGQSQVPKLSPERFLHLWDPITVFFAEDRGPASPGVEVAGEHLLSVNPPHPGAFLWVNARTLQFRPAEPWRAFARYTVTWPGGRRVLVAVPDPPEELVPAPREEAQEVREVTLAFAHPVDQEGLAAALRVVVTPRGEGGRPQAFAGKTLELKVLAGEGKTRYSFRFPAPLPPESQVTVELASSVEGAPEVVWYREHFFTAAGFYLTAVGCGDQLLPLPASGLRLKPQEALPCPSGSHIRLRFSQPLGQPSVVEVRNLLRLSPPVADWRFEAWEKEIVIGGSFRPGTTYRLDLGPSALKSARGAAFSGPKGAVVYLAFPEAPRYLQLAAGSGTVERSGPKMVPVTGQGQDLVEVTLIPIDPLAREFFPFPSQPVQVEEAGKPPAPGEERFAARDLANPADLAQRLRIPPKPGIQELVRLPLGAGKKARFGLNLEPLLAKLGKPDPAGAYLLGLRRPESTARQWMRVDVTDLSLTVVEKSGTAAFAVTSLATAQPVPQAAVTVEGWSCGGWGQLLSGKTDSNGLWVVPELPTFRCPPGNRPEPPTLGRISVQKGADTLVVNPQRGGELYYQGRWTESAEPWLEWAFRPEARVQEGARLLAHVFCERPVYRPEEAVHIKGYARLWQKGHLKVAQGTLTVTVTAESGARFSFPVTLSPFGSFYLRFQQENLPSGEYRVRVEDPARGTVAETSFRMEAYRIPNFEVQLSAPDDVPLDRPFTVKLQATYYAGGRVVGRPVRFRVTQFPYHWQTPAWEGYAFSSDARYGELSPFRATPAVIKEDLTDDTGAATLTLDPGAEPTAQPRMYLVEATVVGADDQTVTASRRVTALPPFVLGLSVPRFIPQGGRVEASVVVVDARGKALAGQSIKVRLSRRSWHSVLTESDFTLQAPKYLTRVVDEKLEERSLVSEDHPLKLAFTLPQAGVYVVEVEGTDRLGRSQRVALDFFAGGEEAVSWPRKESKTFRLVAEKPAFVPGEDARFVLESPFQEAWGLVVVEAPEGNLYQWVRVEGGKGSFAVLVNGAYAPAVPVHCVLMRGRVPSVLPQVGTPVDLGKPSTVAASTELKVEPQDKKVFLRVEHNARAFPGETVRVTVHLADEKGQPLAGEATLWLVDLAVLALGKEAPLDPLPSFLAPHRSQSVFRDTRNALFGFLPLVELPGGERPAEEALLFERNTVRRRFESVPYYNPSLVVGPEGKATVEVKLPDNLTVFAVRAKAVAGDERFGFATSRLEVRQPVLAQPVAPRFLRFGDRAELGLLARVVEGPGGPAQVRLEARELSLSAQESLELDPARPARVTHVARVPAYTVSDKGEPSLRRVRLAVAVRRQADGAGDAVEIALPLRLPATPVLERQVLSLAPGKPVTVPPVPPDAAPGTVRRRVVVSAWPQVAQLVAALSFFHEYPFGCTEQRLSRARSYLAHKTLLEAFFPGEGKVAEQAVAETLAWLPRVLDRNDLVAFWPQTQGDVTLTAWALKFLVEAKRAGFVVPEPLVSKLERALERVVSEDLGLVAGVEHWQRAHAIAALAMAGKATPSALSELARRAPYLDAESQALALQAMARAGKGDSRAAGEIGAELARRVLVRSHQGREAYAGFSGVAGPGLSQVFPSESRTVAEVLRALWLWDRTQPRIPVLLAALVRLGTGDGWGDTSANAAACLALADILQANPPVGGVTVALTQGSERTDLVAEKHAPLPQWTSSRPEGLSLSLAEGPGAAVLVETSYLPGKPQPAGAAGFVVQRQWLRVSPQGTVTSREDATPDKPFRIAAGDVVEEHVEVVNPEDRAYVAIVVPLAAGTEVLNPNLATAPPEAKPSGTFTRPPSYRDFGDDQVVFYYNELPKGTYHLYFRTRAELPGTYALPAASAELMYQRGVRGWSASTQVIVEEKP